MISSQVGDQSGKQFTEGTFVQILFQAFDQKEYSEALCVYWKFSNPYVTRHV